MENLIQYDSGDESPTKSPKRQSGDGSTSLAAEWEAFESLIGGEGVGPVPPPVAAPVPTAIPPPVPAPVPRVTGVPPLTAKDKKGTKHDSSSSEDSSDGEKSDGSDKSSSEGSEEEKTESSSENESSEEEEKQSSSEEEDSDSSSESSSDEDEKSAKAKKDVRLEKRKMREELFKNRFRSESPEEKKAKKENPVRKSTSPTHSAAAKKGVANEKRKTASPERKKSLTKDDQRKSADKSSSGSLRKSHEGDEKKRRKSRSRSHERDHRRRRSKSHDRRRRKRSDHRERRRSRDRKESSSSKHDKDRKESSKSAKDSKRERSPGSRDKRKRSRSRDKNTSSRRDADRRRRSRERTHRDSRDSRRSRDRGGNSHPSRTKSRSPERPNRTYKEQLRLQFLEAQKKTEANGQMDVGKIKELMIAGKVGDKPLSLQDLMKAGGQITPQEAIIKQMEAMHQKAQEITGVAVPKYYNPAAVNPLKYAEQVQKRKLLWSKSKDKKEDDVAMWQGLSFGGDEVDSKFRKLMGIHGEEAAAQQPLTKQSVEQIKKQQELFEHLDKEYQFARMTTHTHRGMGLGNVSSYAAQEQTALLDAQTLHNTPHGVIKSVSKPT